MKCTDCQQVGQACMYKDDMEEMSTVLSSMTFHR